MKATLETFGSITDLVRDEVWSGPRLAAEVAARAALLVRLGVGATLAKGALGTWCAERMRHEAVPERRFFMAQIPRTERGKLDRAAVRERCLGGGAAA